EYDTSPDSWAPASNDTDANELGSKDSEAPDRDTSGDKDEGRILRTPTDQARLTISLPSASGAHAADVPVTLGVDGAEDPPETLTTGGEAVTSTLQASTPGTLSVTASAEVAPQTVQIFEPTTGTRV